MINYFVLQISKQKYVPCTILCTGSLKLVLMCDVFKTYISLEMCYPYDCSTLSFYVLYFENKC